MARREAPLPSVASAQLLILFAGLLGSPAKTPSAAAGAASSSSAPSSAAAAAATAASAVSARSHWCAMPAAAAAATSSASCGRLASTACKSSGDFWLSGGCQRSLRRRIFEFERELCASYLVAQVTPGSAYEYDVWLHDIVFQCKYQAARQALNTMTCCQTRPRRPTRARGMSGV